MAEVVRELKNIWQMMPESELQTHDSISTDPRKNVSSSSSSSTTKDPYVTSDISGNDLVLSYDESKFRRVSERAFMTLCSQDYETFTSTMFLYVDQLQNQLDKDEFQKDKSMAAFWVFNNQFQKFIDWQYFLDYDREMTKKLFTEYIGIKYDRRMNERQMQSRESKVVSSKALDASLVVTECNGIKSDEHITSSSSKTYITQVMDAYIRPVNNQVPSTEVHDNVDVAAQGPDTAVLGDDAQDQSIPSPTPPTPPPQQHQDIPSTSQEAIDACAGLTRRVEHLEHDKVAQDLEITKLKTRVKKLKRANKGRMIAELDRDEGIALIDDEGAEKKAEDAQVAGDEQVKGRQAEIYQIDMDHATKVLSMQKDEPEVQEAVEVVTTAKLITEVVDVVSESVSAASATIAVVPAATITAAPIKDAATSTRRRKGVVIRDPEEESTAKIPDETKSKDKGKGIMTEAQARRNMIMYLKNTTGFRLDYFKGMSYDDICTIFKAKFNSNIEFLLNSKEQIEEEENKALESINETPAQKAAKRRKLNDEVKDVKDLK
uniref:Probable LRR receptor-like serine/threonine-protein kinase At1g06840 isoform X1 n=1 Tax=Tanacetum cinerariifolium TaxID=118510 RepID=A0A6L2MQT2_TANCI|nr:probable LRR receptor-like serine/threonine-protein kinase At1g06840 isoform X1 [Tanacetum cinerariifolium]